RIEVNALHAAPCVGPDEPCHAGLVGHELGHFAAVAAAVGRGGGAAGGLEHRPALERQTGGEVHQMADPVGGGIGGQCDVIAASGVADKGVARLEHSDDGVAAV